MSTAASSELDYTTLPRPPSRTLGDWLILLPILLATGASLYFTVDSILFRITRPYPLTPWESEMITDGYRVTHGLPVFEPQSSGHSMHMYGPGVTYTLAAMFSVTGPNVFAGRAVQLFGGLGFTALLVWALSRRGLLEIFVAAGLALALHYRCRAYFTETRPDVFAMFLATIAVLLFYRAEESEKRWLYLPGTIAVLGALYYKQTFCAAAGVVPLAVLVRRPPELFKRLAISLIPLASIIAALVLTKLMAPVMFYYMVETSKLYPIRFSRVIVALISLATFCPVFYILAIGFSLDRRAGTDDGGKLTWLTVATIVGVVASIAPFAKRGGTYNSLLLAFAPMAAFCIVAIGWLFDKLQDHRRDWLVRAFASVIVGGSIIATTLSTPKSELWNYKGAHGDKSYSAAWHAAQKLPGNVVSFDDPTIALRAKGFAGRCLEVELDASGHLDDGSGATWIPPGMVDEIRSADWVVRVHGNYDSYVSAKQMQKWGFKQVKWLKDKSVYSLWRRKSSATSPTSTQSIDTPDNQQVDPTTRPD